MLTRRALLQGIGLLAAAPVAVVTAEEPTPAVPDNQPALRITNKQIVGMMDERCRGLTLLVWDRNFQPRVLDHFGMRVIEYIHGRREPHEITHVGRHCGQSLRQRVIEQLRNEKA